MHMTSEQLEAKRDELLDAIEWLTARIYEERVALEVLEREVSNAHDGEPGWSAG